MRRFLKHTGRLFLALFISSLPIVLAVVMVLLFSGPGRGVLARVIGDRLSRNLRGQFQIGGVSGSILRSLTLRNVVVRDTSGALLAQFPRLRVTYNLPTLLARSLVLTRVELDSPTVHLTKRANGRMNYEEVLKLSEGPPSGKPGPLIEFHDVWVRQANLVLSMPWSPPDSVHTPAGTAAALAADRAHPGREIDPTPDGLKKVIRFVPLTAHFPKLRLTTPKHEPFAFEIDTLATRISDPALTITHLVAHGWTAGDSLQFTAAHASLPDTRVQGGGTITWPRGPILFDFSFNAARLNLNDLLWINPGLPPLAGKGKVVAKSESDTKTDYQLSDLALRGAPGALKGKVTLLVDQKRGLGFKGMDLDLDHLDLSVMKPFVPDLPFEGKLTGPTRGDGYLTDMAIDVNWLFEDAKVPAPAETEIAMKGRVRLGGDAGLYFDQVTVDSSDIDLRTVRRLAPAVPLNGRVAASGSVNGSLHNVVFDGTMDHQDGERPVSTVEGKLGLDTRKNDVVFDVDGLLNPLSFDGIRGSFPGMTARGEIHGPITLRGPLARLETHADVEGQVGHIKADGGLTVLPPKLGAESLTVVFDHVDLPQLLGKGPNTALAGTLKVNGIIDSLVPPEGRLEARLSPGRIDAFAFDSMAVAVDATAGRLMFDTLTAVWQDGRLDGRGELGWHRDQDGELTVQLAAARLTAFDTVATLLLGEASDSVARAHPLDGTASGLVRLRGSIDSLDANAQLEVRDLSWRTLRSPADSIELAWSGGVRPRSAVAVVFDSLSIGQWSLHNADLHAAGFTDSLGWGGSVDIGRLGRASSAGTMQRLPLGYLVVLDSLRAVLPDHSWRLVAPSRALVGDSVVAVSPVRFEAEDGAGELKIGGLLPRAAGGQLRLSAASVPMRDVYAMLQWDTTQVHGTFSLNLELTGTASNPEIHGGLALADVGLEDFSAPLIQGSVHYTDKQLKANLDVWKTGASILQLEAALPLDLALHKVARRQLPGPILIRAHSDSTDLTILEAVTRAVRQVTGSLAVDAELGGTWDAPALSGTLALRGVGANLPGLGVRYDNINGKALFHGDSISLESFRLNGGNGTLEVTGGLRLEKLTHPVLNLTLKPDNFQAMDLRGVASLNASGDLKITGSPLLPTISGQVTANEGAYYFADLINKRVVDLENPGDSSLIDLEQLRTARLGNTFMKRFLDSLTIQDLRVTMGESFWLRSTEANVQLEGGLLVNKQRANYRVDGTLSTVRGSYQLRVGPVIRDFTVEHGTVQYYGNPSLNADLDITARHVVHTTDNVSGTEDLPVIAHITGTMLAPKLELTTDASRGALSTTELVSYLMFGRSSISSGEAGASADQTAVTSAMSYLSSALSSELQRTLVTDLRLPIDYIEIRPGSISRPGAVTQNGASQVAQLAAGWRIGHSFFVTVHADVCTNQTRFYPDVEYRLSREFRLSATLEPVASCTDLLTLQSLQDRGRYQFGVDLIWEREH
ncbi:MAG: translocation/assembly module TamB domain-containing protein [Gemmatimonadota bacterium]